MSIVALMNALRGIMTESVFMDGRDKPGQDETIKAKTVGAGGFRTMRPRADLRAVTLATLACLISMTSAVLAETPSDLQQVTAAAEGFYAAYSTFHPSDGIPDASARAKLDPFISSALDALLIAGDATEKHFSAVTKNMSPPLIEGDLFTSNFEGATSYHVGACSMEASLAHCTATFGYRGGPEDSRPVNWTDTIYLQHTSAGWKVDDVAYGGNAAFGNKGRLKETLQNAIRDGNDAAQ
jgi:hypothetical protein